MMGSKLPRLLFQMRDAVSRASTLHADEVSLDHLLDGISRLVERIR